MPAPSLDLWGIYACSSLLAPTGVWDEFRSGGGGGGRATLKSLARRFSPLLARKSSGFARILLAFLPENGYLKYSGGGGMLQPP